VTRPSSHRTIRITAIVYNIISVFGCSGFPRLRNGEH
jgi:hypothetical protein